MSKLTHRLASAFALAAIVFTIGSAWAEGEDVGGRVHCYPVVGVGKTTWAYCNSGTSYSGDLNGTYVFDVGSARDITYAFYANTSARTAHQIWGSNSLDNYATYSAAGSGWTKLYDIPKSGWTYSMAAPNWPTRVVGTENQCYRYYLMHCSSIANIHLLFYAKELLVSQNNPVVISQGQILGATDASEGVKFTGTVDFVPDEGAATVTLYVAKTDHGDDLAAWQADASLHAFPADGTYATGAAYTIYAPELAQGVWFGRVFATAGGTTRPSQRTAEFAVGTSPYYPPAYMYSASYVNRYDGTFNWKTDREAKGMIFLVDDDPDVEIVAVRLWSANSVSRSYTGAFSEDAGATFDFGVLTPISSTTTRTLSVPENWPTSGWIGLGSFYSKLDWYLGVPGTAPYDITLHPQRWAKFVRFSGVDLENWEEVEFRTLPRPPEPIVHDFAMGEPKGTSIGLTGYLAYRGNANKSPCTIYASCVPPGTAADYKVIKEGWENATDWAGVITGLSGETDYVLNVIVSNELAGVQVITNAAFTTPKFVPMPPSITFTGVTPDSEGNVTFSWNLTDPGTAAGAVDVYAKWGPDVDNLCEGVKIAEGVAIGLGSAKCETVEAGADLVFVLYAVNNGGTDAEGTKTSALTDPKEATTFGPSSFASGTITREANTGVIRANGSIDVFGLGQSRVEIAYAYVGSSETNTILVRTCQEGDTKSFNLTTNLNALAEGAVYCELRLTNSGRGKTWVSVADSKKLICGPTLPSHFNNTYQTGNAIGFGFKVLFDGSFGTYLDNMGGPFTIDLGNKRTVHGAWLGFKNVNGRTTTLYTSEDGVNYTPVMAYPLAAAVTDKYVDFVFPSPVANVRYLKIQGNGQRLDLAEFHAIGASSDLVVSMERIQAWGNMTGTKLPVNAADDPQGVYFSGKLVSGGSAHIYACLSRKDLGADAEAWLKSTHKDLGEFASGETISGYLPGAAPGIYYGKLVAVRTSDDATVVSPQVLRTVVGSKTFPNEILMNSSAMGNAERIYDGINNNFKADCGGSFVFPLKDLGGRIPASIRLWPNSGSSRLKKARIYISSNAMDFVTADYRTEPKPIKTYASEPSGIVWTEIANFGKHDDFVEADMFWEIPLLMPTSKAAADVFKNATYIKVANIELNNCSEMELRLLRQSGMVFRVR